MPQATSLLIAYHFHVVSLCFLLSLLSPPLCLPPPPSPSPHTPSHHPGQPMWSEWRLIQGVRPCLKCNKLPLGRGMVHPSQHITREGACTPPSLTPPPQLCHPSSCVPVRIISIVRTGWERRPAETWVEVGWGVGGIWKSVIACKYV